MNRTVMTISLILCCGSAGAEEADRLLYSDDFAGESLADAWEIHEGKWFVQDGVLINDDGGVISLKAPPGGQFSLEFELSFPSKWMSVIPFLTTPDNFGTVYLTNGYWETFELKGDSLGNYVQRRDADIATGNGFHHLKLSSDYGLLMLEFDGKVKGPATLPYRPGSRIAFRSLPGAGRLQIRQLRVKRLDAKPLQTVADISVNGLADGVILQDERFSQRKDVRDRLPVDADSESAILRYEFSEAPEFESRFARIATNAKQCSRLLFEVEGDNSENTMFVILHDASGEQHLVMKTSIAWQGAQDVGINLQPFLIGPPKLERHRTHWGGDGNQQLDFPITAIDVGVSKRSERTRHSGEIRLRHIRFAAESP